MKRGKMKSTVAVGGLVLMVAVATIVLIHGAPTEQEEVREEASTYESTTYSEVFESPIDPNSDTERHEEIFRKIDKSVGFDVLSPSKVPDGHKLIGVRSTGESPADPLSGFTDVGGFTASYVTNENKNYSLFEGVSEPGGLGYGEKIILSNGDIAYYWELDNGERLLWFASKPEFSATLTSSDLERDSLVEIANNFLQ